MKRMVLLAIFVGLLADLSVGAERVGAAEGGTQLQQRDSSTPVDAAYTLGAGDRVRIEVFRMPQYSGENSVMVDGSLNLPVVGSVDVEGMTLAQAADAISGRYAQILRRPLVTVSLITPRPIEIGVVGEVNRPGAYTVNRDGAQFPSITQLLETAGGVRQSADLRRIQVRRPQRPGVETIIAVDLWQFLRTGDLQHNFSLRDGDTVVVPPAETINLAEAAQIASTSFAPAGAPINIAIVGQVFRPGTYTVSGNARTAQAGVPGGLDQGGGLAPTVTRAIQVAGGIMPDADIRQVQIRRTTRAGTEQVLTVSLWELLKAGDLNQDVILQEGDTVVVPLATALDPTEANQIASASFSPNTIRVNVVGEVVRPGVVEVPPNTPLNQALLSAGGFTNRAARREVELIRLNGNGSVARQELPIDFAQGINEGSNPALRNNDVIIVRRSGFASTTDALEAVTNPIARFFTLFSLPLNLFRLF
ncbi:polysaccharide biosynthesis/export family protein [Leptolyngbya sp. AN02str]|uniref:polysaccharide biosynthesis/export family protein n=1 Tax=Leptolyngbya sp. AN02str TaxID=3423363 RepID=UPI003D32079F